VASDSSDSGEQGESEGQGPASHEPRECMACRGSGRVISNLGGAPNELTCPWCGGGGVRQADVDARARWLEQDGDGAVAAPEPAS
jgi:DnaJ-class molecular chaperone